MKKIYVQLKTTNNVNILGKVFIIMKQLNEKVAIVTGAGQGIGKGIALCLAKRGVKVVATGRRLEPIEQTIAEIKEFGEEFSAILAKA